MAYDRERAIQAAAVRTRTKVERTVESLNHSVQWLREHAGVFVQLDVDEEQHVVIEGFIHDHRRTNDGD